jgi:hypothetical protein
MPTEWADRTDQSSDKPLGGEKQTDLPRPLPAKPEGHDDSDVFGWRLNGTKPTSKSATSIEANAEAKVQRSLDDLSSLRGASIDGIRSLVPEGWVEKPLKKYEGVKFLNPDRPGEAIMIEKGRPDATDPLHSGPYLKISKDGIVERIPLEGNPVLK